MRGEVQGDVNNSSAGDQIGCKAGSEDLFCIVKGTVLDPSGQGTCLSQAMGSTWHWAGQLPPCSLSFDSGSIHKRSLQFCALKSIKFTIGL